MHDPGEISVLHVDDDPAFADLTAEVLDHEDDRVSVATATSADEGLSHLADHDVDCIVSDYDMPGMDGIEFLKAIREDHPEMPFILCTGKGSEEVASEALSAGATDYIQKRPSSDQYELLANRVQNAVEQFRTKQRRATLEHIRSLVNDINQALIRADSREQIEAQVCDILAESDPYRFAVVADVTSEPKRIDPRTWAGAGEAFLDEFEMTIEEGAPGRHAPGGRAFHEREIAVAQNLQTDSAYEPWRELALEHDFRALAVVPLEYEDTLYGLLAVFADRPHAFDDTEVETLAELGDDIAHAIHAQKLRDELRDSQRRFAAIFNDPRMLIGVLDTDGTVLDVNQTALEFVDVDRADVLGEQFWTTRWWPADLRNDVQQWVEAAAAGEYVDYEADLTTPDGEPYSVEGTVRPVTDSADEVVSLVVSARDVTERRERERDLEEERAFIDQTLAALNDIFYVIDPDGDPRRWNDRFREVTGYSDDGIAEMDAIEFFAAADRERVAEAIEETLATGEATVEAALLTAEGDRLPYEFTGARLTDPEGTVTGIVGIGRDITERKEREQEFERLRDFFTEAEQLGELGAWEFDETGAVVWTDGTRRIHEVDDEFDPTLEDGLEFFHPEDRATIRDAVDRALEEGEPYDVQARLITAEGTLRWVRTRGKPVEDETGPTTIRGYIQDITAQKERERELRRYEELIETLPIGYVRTTPDGEFRAMNETFVTMLGGESADAIRSRDVTDFYRDTATRERLLTALRETGQVRDQELKVTTLTGETIWISITARLIETAEDRYIDALVQDITERKERERELERQNERLDEFASVVSHDLQNPLAVVQGRLALAREECASDHLAGAANAVDRMEQLIDDLLTLAREGEQVSALEPVDLAEIAEGCWRTIETADASLAVETTQTIRADPSRLQQLLANLFGNAVEHGGDDVTVTVGDLADGAGFYMADDGPGIPADKHEVVFEAGYSTSEEGTGFGLSIVQEIAEAHGWDVTVTTSSAGGARFEITDVETVAG